MTPVLKPVICLSSVCLLLFVAAGCATPQYNYRPHATQISTPPLNTVVTANVGDEMLKQGTFYERDAIRLQRPLKFGLFGNYTLMPGIYVKTGQKGGNEFYRPGQGKDAGAVQKAILSDPWEAIELSDNGTRICVVTVFHAALCRRAVGVKRVKYLALSDNSFQQTLIYSGKIGSSIKVGYREFSNDLARPAFNNDVEYDLKTSSVIGYKGARIEVLKATNETITYRVISNFNRAKY